MNHHDIESLLMAELLKNMRKSAYESYKPNHAACSVSRWRLFVLFVIQLCPGLIFLIFWQANLVNDLGCYEGMFSK